MNMKKITAVLLAATSLYSASAMADQYTTSITGVPSGYTDLSSSVSFAGFDGRGTLQSVLVTLSATLDGTVTVYNFTGASVAGGSVALDGLLGFSTGSVASASNAGNVYTKTYGSIADGDTWTYTGSGTVSSTTTFTSGLDYFKTALVTGTAAVGAKSTATSAEFLFSEFSTQAVGTGTVTYIYAPVPEPETYGMLLAGLGLMGVIARRKSRKA